MKVGLLVGLISVVSLANGHIHQVKASEHDEEAILAQYRPKGVPIIGRNRDKHMDKVVEGMDQHMIEHMDRHNDGIMSKNRLKITDQKKPEYSNRQVGQAGSNFASSSDESSSSSQKRIEVDLPDEDDDDDDPDLVIVHSGIANPLNHDHQSLSDSDLASDSQAFYDWIQKEFGNDADRFDEWMKRKQKKNDQKKKMEDEEKKQHYRTWYPLYLADPDFDQDKANEAHEYGQFDSRRISVKYARLMQENRDDERMRRRMVDGFEDLDHAFEAGAAAVESDGRVSAMEPNSFGDDPIPQMIKDHIIQPAKNNEEKRMMDDDYYEGNPVDSEDISSMELKAKFLPDGTELISDDEIDALVRKDPETAEEEMKQQNNAEESWVKIKQYLVENPSLMLSAVVFVIALILCIWSISILIYAFHFAGKVQFDSDGKETSLEREIKMDDELEVET